MTTPRWIRNEETRDGVRGDRRGDGAGDRAGRFGEGSGEGEVRRGARPLRRPRVRGGDREVEGGVQAVRGSDLPLQHRAGVPAGRGLRERDGVLQELPAGGGGGGSAAAEGGEVPGGAGDVPGGDGGGAGE